MSFTPYSCPNCGTLIYADRENPLGICEYCGTQTVEGREPRQRPTAGRALKQQEPDTWEVWYAKAKEEMEVPLWASQYGQAKKSIARALELAPAAERALVDQKLEPLRRYNEKRRRQTINYYLVGISVCVDAIIYGTLLSISTLRVSSPILVGLFAYATVAVIYCLYLFFHAKPLPDFEALERKCIENEATGERLLNKLYSRFGVAAIAVLLLVGVLVYQLGWYTFNGWSKQEYNSFIIPEISYSFYGGDTWQYYQYQEYTRVGAKLSEQCNCRLLLREVDLNYFQGSRSDKTEKYFFIDGHEALINTDGDTLYIAFDENVTFEATAYFGCKKHGSSYYKKFFDSFRIIHSPE